MTLAAGAELGAAQDVAAADDDGQLHAALVRRACACRAMLSVSSMLMPLLPGVAEALAAELEDDALVFRLQRIGIFVHGDCFP